MRTERAIFEDLEEIAVSRGYAHVIAYFCFRDNMIRCGEVLEADDILRQYSKDKLIKNEISILVGLMIKGDINICLLEPEETQNLIDNTEALLSELHQSMMEAAQTVMTEVLEKDPDGNPFLAGKVLRESIFYGGGSAYHFQYKDFTLLKYQNDNEWFLKNKGYSVSDAHRIIQSVLDLQVNKTTNTVNSWAPTEPDLYSFLHGFCFCCEDIVKETGLTHSVVLNFLISLACPSPINNSEFRSVDDFNIIDAYPLIRLTREEFLLFHTYSLVEAFYQTPFYWMLNNGEYKNTASINRGNFTEQLSKRRLSSVFGEDRVFENVTIENIKNELVGEIDVLVLFGDRAIVLQAKSKKLTLEARKGSELALSADFTKSVQSSYDQGLICCKHLLAHCGHNFKRADRTYLKIPQDLKEIYILSVVSDHYPSLHIQAKAFLKYEVSEILVPPVVMDVFFLDVMCEMLNTPLLFISYLNRRSTFFNRIPSSEYAILSYHLTQNLWGIAPDNSSIVFDEICAGLDVAMRVRRTGMSGTDTPPGILHEYKRSHIGNILKRIEVQEHAAGIDFGLLILRLSKDAIRDLNKGIETVCSLAQADGKRHDLTISIANSGLTIHSSQAPVAEAMEVLKQHCQLEKYAFKAPTWFGTLFSPAPSFSLITALKLKYPYEYSPVMEEVLPKILKPGKTSARGSNQKLERNAVCYCGSKKKYKKCCGRF